MHLTRRRFCLATLLAGCAAPIGRLPGAEATVDDAFKTGLRAWMETLYPSDKISPGAGRLDVHLDIIGKARPNPDHIGLLIFGIRWADSEARQIAGVSFAEIQADPQEAIVAKAEAMGTNGLPGYFFLHTRIDGAEFYYARKESWAGLPLQRTPQPIGFPFYSKAPE